MITDGQARRIAAEWQAPGNAMSALQHVGEITHDTADEITANRRHVGANPMSYADPRAAMTDLTALLGWVYAHGVGTVPGWGEWDDEPVHVGYPHEPGTLYDCPACDMPD